MKRGSFQRSVFRAEAGIFRRFRFPFFHSLFLPQTTTTLVRPTARSAQVAGSGTTS